VKKRINFGFLNFPDSCNAYGTVVDGQHNEGIIVALAPLQAIFEFGRKNGWQMGTAEPEI
jgi:hypothetical protein